MQRYDEIFPYVPAGVLLSAPYPEPFECYMAEASADYFLHHESVANHEDGLRSLDNNEI
jgi:hypothetical protein